MSNFLIQSNYGTTGNFEAVVQGPTGLVHVWLDNDTPGSQWNVSKTNLLLHNIQGVALIQSSYGYLEIVVVDGNNQAKHYYRPSMSDSDWAGPTQTIASGVSGWPAFIQSGYGTVGNFEVVVPSHNGGLQHYWRNNDLAGNPPWNFTKSWETGTNYVGASLIQSSYGNLEVVGTSPHEENEGELIEFVNGATHFFRDSSGNWYATTAFGDAITGTASLIQSNFGTPGNFEVVAPYNLVQEISHSFRNNSAPSQPWASTGEWGPGLTLPGGGSGYVATALIQSKIDNSLVAAALLDEAVGLDIYIRENGSAEFVLQNTITFPTG